MVDCKALRPAPSVLGWGLSSKSRYRTYSATSVTTFLRETFGLGLLEGAAGCYDQRLRKAEAFRTDIDRSNDIKTRMHFFSVTPMHTGRSSRRNASTSGRAPVVEIRTIRHLIIAAPQLPRLSITYTPQRNMVVWPTRGSYRGSPVLHDRHVPYRALVARRSARVIQRKPR
jgi:hypothetical protein